MDGSGQDLCRFGSYWSVERGLYFGSDKNVSHCRRCTSLGTTHPFNRLNDLEEKIRIKTDVIKREIEEYNSQTQTSTAKTLEARSVSEENVDE